MACILRADGLHFDVDAFVQQSALEVYLSYRKGEPRNAASRVLNDCSGICVMVSEAEFTEFDDQCLDAIAFLDAHQYELRQLVSWPGVERARLDFGTGWLDAAAQFWYFSPELIELLGTIGLSLELSHYPTSG